MVEQIDKETDSIMKSHQENKVSLTGHIETLEELNDCLDKVRREYYFAKESHKVKKEEQESLKEELCKKKARNQNIHQRSDRLWSKVTES